MPPVYNPYYKSLFSSGIGVAWDVQGNGKDSALRALAAVAFFAGSGTDR